MNGRERNLGVELLRIICMTAIVGLHLLGHGWITQLLNVNSWKYSLAIGFESLCMSGISCYALISGYVGIQSRYRYSALALQWLKVWLYSVLFTVIAYVIAPGNVDRDDVLRALFPVLRGQYWYFSSYVACFALTPLLRMAMLRMNRRQAGFCAAGVVLVYCVASTLSQTDALNVGSGKNALWLAAMYVLGAYIGRFGLLAHWPQKRLALLTLAIAAAAIGAGEILSRTGLLFGSIDVGYWLMRRSNSPMALLLAVSMLLLFSRIRITRGKQAVASLAAASFGVYLIHDHPLVRQLTISRYAYQLAGLPTQLIIPGIVLAAIGVYLICALIDMLRERVFRALRVRQRLAALEERLIGDLWAD